MSDTAVDGNSQSGSLMEPKVAWVTGAGSGIGRALVDRLYAQGYSMILSGRNKDSLQSVANELLCEDRAGRNDKEGVVSESRQAIPKTSNQSVSIIPFDVSDENQVAHVQNALSAVANRLDLVVANAGACEYLNLDEPDWSMMARIAKVNYFGVVNTLSASFPLLSQTARFGGRPHFVGISSQAMLMPFSLAEAYGASKAAAHYFLQSLRMDFAHKNIDVTSVLPGFVATPMTKQNNFSMPFIMSPEQAAMRIEAGIRKRPAVFAFPKKALRYAQILFDFPWALVSKDEP